MADVQSQGYIQGEKADLRTNRDFTTYKQRFSDYIKKLNIEYNNGIDIYNATVLINNTLGRNKTNNDSIKRTNIIILIDYTILIILITFIQIENKPLINRKLFIIIIINIVTTMKRNIITNRISNLYFKVVNFITLSKLYLLIKVVNSSSKLNYSILLIFFKFLNLDVLL